MIEVAFDIATGANFKFNTAILGQLASGQDSILVVYCCTKRPTHPLL